MRCHTHEENCTACSTLHLKQQTKGKIREMSCYFFVILGVFYLLTIAPAAGTLVCMEEFVLVFVWIQKLCSHWMSQR